MALRIVLAAPALTCVTAATAEAGTYTVWSCRGPLGEPASTAASARSVFDDSAGGIVLSDSCASGGDLEIALSSTTTFPPPLKPTGMATFDLPAGSRIAGDTLWRSIDTAAAFPVAGYQYAAAVREGSSSLT
jgi:hypothetical protein